MPAKIETVNLCCSNLNICYQVTAGKLQCVIATYNLELSVFDQLSTNEADCAGPYLFHTYLLSRHQRRKAQQVHVIMSQQLGDGGRQMLLVAIHTEVLARC